MVTQNIEDPQVNPDENQPILTLEEEIAQMALAADELNEDSDDVPPVDDVDEAPVDGAAPDGAAWEAPVAETVVEPAPVDELAQARAEIERLKQESAQRQREAELAQLDAQIRSYADQFARNLVETRGWDEEQAKAYAEAERRNYMYEQQLRQMETYQKQVLANQLSQEYGVPAAALMSANSEAEMRNVASQIGPNKKRIDELEREIREIKKSQIPSQNYNRPAGRISPSNEDRQLDLYNAGVRTPETEAAGRRAAGL